MGRNKCSCFVLRAVFFHVISCVTRYMYDARRQDFALSASFVSEFNGVFDGSEVTGKGNDPIAQKQSCVVEEIKEVELRSRHRKFI